MHLELFVIVLLFAVLGFIAVFAVVLDAIEDFFKSLRKRRKGGRI